MSLEAPTDGMSGTALEPARPVVPSAARRILAFRPARIYLVLVAGFGLCLWLTDTILPALGLGELAAAVHQPLDQIARYAIFTLILVIVAGLWRVDRGAGGFGAAAGLLLQWCFFEWYNLPLALTGLALLGAAVWLGCRRRAGPRASARQGDDR